MKTLRFFTPDFSASFYFLTSSAIRVFCCAIPDLVPGFPRAHFGVISGFDVGFDVGATRLGVTFDAAVAVKVGLDGADRLIGFGFDSTSMIELIFFMFETNVRFTQMRTLAFEMPTANLLRFVRRTMG